MSKRIYSLYKKNGALFTAQYLKQTLQFVMWYVGSKSSGTPPPKMNMYISLTKCGLPRFIPPFYRRELRDMKDVRILKLVMSVCAFYRLMKVGGANWRRVNRKTIHFTNFKLSDDGWNYCRNLTSTASSIIKAYAPGIERVPLNLGFRWHPNFNSGPNTYKNPEVESILGTGEWLRTFRRLYRRKCGTRWVVPRFSMTNYHSLPIDATALMTLFKPEVLSKIGSVLYLERTHLGVDAHESPVKPVREGTLGFGWFLESLFPIAEKLWWPKMTTRPEAGRFGLKLEGAGKVRVFAIPSPIFQCLLKPLHDWAMSVLRLIKMDGTYDQLKPLLSLKGKRVLYSFDLKAATDLLPAQLTGSMLVGLFGDDLAEVWYILMNQTSFRSPERLTSPMKARVYRFTRGQPLGFYSSWPLFTLTHHMIVWLAAWDVQPTKKFHDYAILGDDIVIANRKVAERYKEIMTKIGGVINFDKSLISHNGCCEFAKRFIVSNHLDRKDASPLSSACVLLAHSALASSVFSVLNCSFKDSFRLRGAGYRVLSKVDRTEPCLVFRRLSQRWKRHWLSIHTESGICPLPLSLWLAFPEKGLLNCYEIGYLRFYFLECSKPREFKNESFSVFRHFYEDESDVEMFSDRLLVTLMKSYLKHLRWYCLAIMNFHSPLWFFTKPPVAPRSVDRVSDDRKILTYGLIYKGWDKVRSFKYFILTPFGAKRLIHVYEIKLFRFKNHHKDDFS